MATEDTYKLPSRNTPLTSSFFRVDRFRLHIMGIGMQRMITSRSKLVVVPPTRKAWKSPQWLENIDSGFHAADMGEQKKISAKTPPQSHVMHKKPTNRIALLKVTVSNTRRYKSSMEIFTAVVVRQYVIIASMMY